MAEDHARTGAEPETLAASAAPPPRAAIESPAGPRPSGPPNDPYRRRGWIAFVLGVLLPPLGHVYAGRAARGMAVWVMSFAAGVLALWIPLHIGWPAGRLALMACAYLLPLLVGLDAARCARAQPVPFTPRPYNRAWAYLLMLVPLFGAGAVVRPLLLAHVAHAWKIVSGSMAPTLLRGDYVLFSPLRGPVPRGTVVSYHSRGIDVVHRVVGLPGDTLQMRGGSLYVNGRLLREPYAVHAPASAVEEARMEWQRELVVGADTAGYHPTLDDWGPLLVPGGNYFMLGDNRADALDSRIAGPVDRADIRQRAVWIYFSLGDDGPRWSRFGQTVR